MKILETQLMVCYFKREIENSIYSYNWRVRAEFYSKHVHSPMSYIYIFVINFLFNPLPYISCLHNFEGSNNFPWGEKSHEDPKREEMSLSCK